MGRVGRGRGGDGPGQELDDLHRALGLEPPALPDLDIDGLARAFGMSREAAADALGRVVGPRLARVEWRDPAPLPFLDPAEVERAFGASFPGLRRPERESAEDQIARDIVQRRVDMLRDRIARDVGGAQLDRIAATIGLSPRAGDPSAREALIDARLDALAAATGMPRRAFDYEGAPFDARGIVGVLVDAEHRAARRRNSLAELVRTPVTVTQSPAFASELREARASVLRNLDRIATEGARDNLRRAVADHGRIALDMTEETFEVTPTMRSWTITNTAGDGSVATTVEAPDRDAALEAFAREEGAADLASWLAARGLTVDDLVVAENASPLQRLVDDARASMTASLAVPRDVLYGEPPRSLPDDVIGRAREQLVRAYGELDASRPRVRTWRLGQTGEHECDDPWWTGDAPRDVAPILTVPGVASVTADPARRALVVSLRGDADPEETWRELFRFVSVSARVELVRRDERGVAWEWLGSVGHDAEGRPVPVLEAMQRFPAPAELERCRRCGAPLDPHGYCPRGPDLCQVARDPASVVPVSAATGLPIPAEIVEAAARPPEELRRVPGVASVEVDRRDLRVRVVLWPGVDPEAALRGLCGVALRTYELVQRQADGTVARWVGSQDRHGVARLAPVDDGDSVRNARARLHLAELTERRVARATAGSATSRAFDVDAVRRVPGVVGVDHHPDRIDGLQVVLAPDASAHEVHARLREIRDRPYLLARLRADGRVERWESARTPVRPDGFGGEPVLFGPYLDEPRGGMRGGPAGHVPGDMSGRTLRRTVPASPSVGLDYSDVRELVDGMRPERARHGFGPADVVRADRRVADGPVLVVDPDYDERRETATRGASLYAARGQQVVRDACVDAAIGVLARRPGPHDDAVRVVADPARADLLRRLGEGLCAWCRADRYRGGRCWRCGDVAAGHATLRTLRPCALRPVGGQALSDELHRRAARPLPWSSPGAPRVRAPLATAAEIVGFVAPDDLAALGAGLSPSDGASFSADHGPPPDVSGPARLGLADLVVEVD